MGEMTIRLDDATMIQLEERARFLGMEPSRLAADVLRLGLQNRPDRAAVARAIQAMQPERSPFDSVDLIREDRDRQ